MNTPSRPVLSDHWECFEGIIPTVIVTASRDGTPNVSYISHVFYIDEAHVALSNLFMSKMVRNIQENPRLQAMVVHPRLGHQLALDLVFVRAETTGPIFDHLAACVTAVASHQGMEKVMRLRSADIYRVLTASIVPGSDDAPRPTWVADAGISPRPWRWRFQCPVKATLIGPSTWPWTVFRPPSV
ncbi:MAG: pyridoxamine 5'-phosphate oxidase family protein [Tabrizicola sp.]|nr:pyridoxamine 5'-phosphate oxidase family protein [Tabrizicola sp.]